MDLKNKTTLITGGGSGIGLALAHSFSGYEGSHVIICGRDEQKLNAAKRGKTNIDAVVCDITNTENINSLVDYIRSKYGSLNIVVNNAGIQNSINILDSGLSIHELLYELNVNFIAHLNVLLKCLPLLRGKHDAAVINVTSALAVVPKQSSPIYNASKAAMRLFTKTLRYQLQETNIRVFEVIPALVDTAMTKGRGKGKIAPEHLARDVVRSLRKDKYEIRIEKVKLLFFLYRFFPVLVERVLRNK